VHTTSDLKASFIWELLGSKAVVCEDLGLWDESSVVGEVVSDVLKDLIVLLFKVQEAHESMSLWTSRTSKTNSVLRSETTKTTCPLTQNCILEHPIPLQFYTHLCVHRCKGQYHLLQFSGTPVLRDHTWTSFDHLEIHARLCV
jgi:hypothetical protein